ncbi:striatin-3-like isoform X2 [Ptychodera flava]|uniref:striatin-3-like isoform X2 n=1 Tax=Ptychodera flava TaxID=63121 RepID=UPI003969C8B9
MDEGTGVQQQHGSQLNAGSSSIIGGSNKPNDDTNQSKYSMPGILHFLQHEWARFEMERSHWEVERAELQARIAFLQGERKGQENLKQDLVRRIKMLEYALKQERSKYHKLKFGTELNQDTKPVFDGEEGEEELPLPQNSQVNFRQGRQLLRQYLQEIGYTDTILDVRSSRVRSLLGLTSNETNTSNLDIENQNIAPIVNGDSDSKPTRQGEQITGTKRTPEKKRITSAEGILDNEASVLSTFDFLSSETIEDEAEDDSDGGSADDESEEREEANKMGTIIKKKKTMIGNESMAGMDDVLAADAETEEALAEFDFLVQEAGEGAGEEWALDKKGDLSPTSEEWGSVDQSVINKLKEEYKKARKGKKAVQRPKRSTLQSMLANLQGEDELALGSEGPPNRPDFDLPEEGDLALETALQVGLGELAGLTVTDEAEPLRCDISTSNKEAFRKTWNPKYTLRSHFDGVRALTFHPVEPVLITASEDHTLKLWNLEKTVPAKKSASLDVEPIYTFRAHVGAVLSIVMSANGDQCYSGGTDATIRCWNIPGSNIDPFDSYEPGVLTDTLIAHTDAIWDLAYDSTRHHLLSSSADNTVKLWSPQSKTPLLNSYTGEKDDGTPTSVDFVRCDPSQMVTGYTSATAVLYDLETATPVLRLENAQPADAECCQINKVVSHPTLPITIAAYEDRHIRFFDNNSGKMVHSMVAHLDAVTSLSIDPNGLYLLSGSHDCSIRLWNLDSKTCVQEITSHRKKFDEAIYAVAFHPSKPYIASGGADALAKVFV